MLIPVIPLLEKSQLPGLKYCLSSSKTKTMGEILKVNSKQLIQDLDYSIPLIPHSHQKLSCLKSGVRVGSHDPFFRFNYFSGIVSAHRILIRMTNFLEFE